MNALATTAIVGTNARIGRGETGFNVAPSPMGKLERIPVMLHSRHERRS